MARKIVQITVAPAFVYDDASNNTRNVVLSATIALCDDGSLWAMQHKGPGLQVRWERYLDIPQDN